VAFCFIGEVAADAKHRSGFSRSLRSKRRQRPQGDQSPGHRRWPEHTSLSKYATMWAKFVDHYIKLSQQFSTIYE
jgi:hypothetical protein